MLVYLHADKVHKVGVKATKPVKKTPGNEALSKLLHLYLGEFIILHPVLPFNQSLKLFWLPGLCKVWQKFNSFRINNPAAKFRRAPRHGRHFDKVEPMSLSIKGY